LNGQLQGELLSACKISQPFPGTRTYAPPASFDVFKRYKKKGNQDARNPAIRKNFPFLLCQASSPTGKIL
jgi:hypothetical protein